MNIRNMKKEDIPHLAALEKMCFSDPWSESAFLYELTNPLSVWLIAESEGVIAGYVGSQTVLDESDMMNIAVVPEFRRQGVGHMLIQRLIEQLRERGSKSLCLEVRVSNVPAIALYEKMGFSQVGLRRGYYRNPREDAYILRKEWD